MKTYNEFTMGLNLNAINEASSNQMRDWVYSHLEDSDMDVDEMKAAFAKKFGKNNMKHFDKFASDYMD